MSPTETLADAQTKYWRLRRAELLDCLSDGEVKALGALCRIRVVERGATVYRAGDASDELFILESGAVKLTRAADDGREVSIGVLGPAEIFGELALTRESARADHAKVLEDAVVCGFECAAFERFLAAHPELALRVAKLIGERLMRAENHIRDILFKDVRTRLAHTVARLADRFGERDAGGLRIAMRLTQTDLAQLIGSTRETTSTIFNEFRRQGLVDSDEQHIVVPDVEALARY